MLDAFIEARGLDPKVRPVKILDPNFAAELVRKLNGTGFAGGSHS